MTEKNLFKRKPEKEPTVAKTDFVMATVTSVTASGICILVDGESEPTSKAYKQLITEHYLAVGDRVIAMLQNGTYVVLGTIGVQEQADDEYYTTDVSEICVATSDFTISSAQYVQWGKMASLYVNGSFTKASSSTSDTTQAFTMVEGKRPRITSAARAWRNANAILYRTGIMEFYGLATSGTGATFLATYLLA